MTAFCVAKALDQITRWVVSREQKAFVWLGASTMIRKLLRHEAKKYVSAGLEQQKITGWPKDNTAPRNCSSATQQDEDEQQRSSLDTVDTPNAAPAQPCMKGQLNTFASANERSNSVREAAELERAVQLHITPYDAA